MMFFVPKQQPHLCGETSFFSPTEQLMAKLSLDWSSMLSLYEFYFHYQRKPQGVRHTKLNLTHLIWLVITTTTTEAQSRDNPDYWSGPKSAASACFSPPHPDTFSWTFTEIPRHSCHFASHNPLRQSSLYLLLLHKHSPILHPIFPLQHYDLNSCTNEKILWHPSSLFLSLSLSHISMHSNTSDNTCKELIRQKKEVMLVKNTHWTYCTHFSQSYKTLLPLLTLSAPPWAHCTPWK